MSDILGKLGDEQPIGFTCPLCNMVYPRLYQVRWQMKHQRKLNLDFICRRCIIEMDSFSYQAKFFDIDKHEDLPFLTGEVRELLPEFLKEPTKNKF